MFRNLIPSAVVIAVTAALFIGLGIMAQPSSTVEVLTPDGRGGFIVEQRSRQWVEFDQAHR